MSFINIFELFASIGLKDEGFNKGIDDATEKGSNFGAKFGSVMAGVGKAAAVGLGVAATAFGALATNALMAGGDLEQSAGGIETLFKESADTVIANAERAYLTAGVNANDYMQQVTSFSASLLQSLGGDTEAAAQVADMAVIDMADNANKMGTSIESIQNAYQGFAKQNYMMLDNLKLGYGGTKTEMERLLADAEKISGIEYDISNLDDVYQAIHVIQGELGITGTTAKEGMETLTGSLATAKAALDNFLSGAGGVDELVSSFSNAADVIVGNLQELLPRLTTGLTGIVQGLIPKIPPIIKELLPAVLTGAMALIDGLVSAVPEVVKVLVGIIPALITAITELLPNVLKAGIDIILTLINGIAEMLPELIPTAVKTVMTLVQTLIDNLPMILDAALQLIMGLAQGILAALPELYKALPDIITGLVNFLLDAIPQIMDAGVMLLTSIVDALPEIINTLIAMMPEISDSLIAALLEALPDMIEAWATLLTSLVQASPQIIVTLVGAAYDIISNIVHTLLDNKEQFADIGVTLFTALVDNAPLIWNELFKAVSDLATGILDKFLSYASDMSEVGVNLIKGLWEGISSMGAWIKDKVGGFFGGVVDGVKGFLGISSPSKIFANIGKMTGEGFVDGIEAMSGAVDNAMDNVFGNLSRDVTANVVPSIGEISAYATPIAATTAESRTISDVVMEGLSAGFAMVSDSILDALPDVLQFYFDTNKVAESTFAAYEEASARRNRMFAPTRAQIEAIARSVMPKMA